MVVVAWKPTTALSRAGVAPNTVKLLPGAPAKAAVIGRPVSANSCCQPSRTARSSLRSLPRPIETAEIGADGGALRVGGLLRHVEAERLRARFAERILRHARDLEAAERRDRRGRGGGE